MRTKARFQCCLKHLQYKQELGNITYTSTTVPSQGNKIHIFFIISSEWVYYRRQVQSDVNCFKEMSSCRGRKGISLTAPVTIVHCLYRGKKKRFHGYCFKSKLRTCSKLSKHSCTSDKLEEFIVFCIWTLCILLIFPMGTTPPFFLLPAFSHLLPSLTAFWKIHCSYKLFDMRTFS